MRAARQRVREPTPIQRVGLPISSVVQDLNRFLVGWAAYFRHGNTTKQLVSFDWCVQNRLCRFIARKYGNHGHRRGLAMLLDSTTRLALHPLGGTVVHDSARPTR